MMSSLLMFSLMMSCAMCAYAAIVRPERVRSRQSKSTQTQIHEDEARKENITFISCLWTQLCAFTSDQKAAGLRVCSIISSWLHRFALPSLVTEVALLTFQRFFNSSFMSCQIVYREFLGCFSLLIKFKQLPSRRSVRRRVQLLKDSVKER